MSHTRVSVVMPVRDEERFIAHSLSAVLAQDYPQDAMEVVIADGESEDRTIDIIRSLPASCPVHIVRNSGRSQASGLNVAVAHARGDIIVRVDGHTIIAPDYVRQCVAALEATGADAVGGCIHPVGTKLVERAIASAMKSPFAVPSAYHVSTRDQYTDQVYLGAWRRDIFGRVGMFDERYLANEDYEFHYRIREGGGKVFLAQAIRSQYHGRQTVRALARQFFTYGRSKPRTLMSHPRSMRPRHLVAPTFVGALVVLPLLALLLFFLPVAGSLAWAFAGGALIALLGLYALCSLLFSFRAARRAHDPQLLGVLPMIFATVHFAWGVGFWAGVFAGDGRPRGRTPLSSAAPLSADQPTTSIQPTTSVASARSTNRHD